MKKLIVRNIGGRRVLLLFIVTNIVYGIMVLITIPTVMSYAGGMKLFDMMPTGYTAEYATALLLALGEQGRSAYVFTQIPFDMVYPFLFGVTYSVMLAYFLDKLGKLHGALVYLCLLPVFAGCFDYLENIGIILMIASYPDVPRRLIHAANVCTMLKSSLSIASFIALTLTLFAFGMSMVKAGRKRT